MPDLTMPVIEKLSGNAGFTNLSVNLTGQGYKSAHAARSAGIATVRYEVHINTFVSPMITAVAVFVIARASQQVQKAAAEQDPATRGFGLPRIINPIEPMGCPT